MTDEPPRNDTTRLIHPLMGNTDSPLLPAVRPDNAPTEPERILAEREARKGLYPPEVSLRRVP
jgi:hypothetical protein